MSILVITTGGTIGALPYADMRRTPEFSTMPPKGQDFVCAAMKEKFGAIKSRCLSLEPRDSKLIDEPYRHNLLKTIAAAPETKILVTHGTDTILRTAEFFHEQFGTNPGLDGKIVVLTGSMIPLTNGPESDGYLNLAYALEQLTHFAGEGEDKRQDHSGIYIVLCDYKSPEPDSRKWHPHLYRYEPDKYEKIYAEDTRYSRLRRRK